MKGAAVDLAATFAANRAIGRISLAVEARAGATRRARVAEQGPLRVRCPGSHPHAALPRLPPNSGLPEFGHAIGWPKSEKSDFGWRVGEGAELEAVILNTAGGVAGGDSLNVEVSLGPGARLIVTTAAAEKIYRTLEPAATIDVKLAVGAGATLTWLPQETILFDRARLKRSIEVDLDESARLLLAEAIVFGRSGMGEVVDDGCLLDRWRLRRSGMLVHAEATRLDGAISQKLAQPAIAKGAVAVATVLVLPADETLAGTLRALTGQLRSEVGVSAWNGLAAMRLCAVDGATLRSDLAMILTSLRGAPLPRLWSN